MNVVQRLFKNTVILFLSHVATQFLGFISLIYLARAIGPDGFGKINFAQALVAYFGILTNLGISTYAVKEISVRRHNLQDLKSQVSNIVSLSLLLAIVAFLCLSIFIIFLNKPLQIKYLLFLYGFSLLTGAFSVGWAFQAVEKMEYMVLPGIIANLSYVILIISFIKSQEQLLFVPCFSLLGGLFGLALSILIFLKIFGRFKLNFDLAIFKHIIVQSIPIGISAILVNAFYQFPTVILGFIRSPEEVGFYSASYKFVSFFIAAIITFYTALFPVTSYYYKKSQEYFKSLVLNTVKLMFILALPLSFGGTILAGSLINLIYGAKFISATPVLQILIWDIVLVYVGAIFGQGLLAANKQKEFSLIAALMAIICLVLNLTLIPILGIRGCAWAILITEIIGVSLQYLRFKKIAYIPLYNFIIKPLIASLVMSLFILGLSNHSRLNVLFVIPIGACIYSILLYLIKGVTKEELFQVWNMVLPNKIKTKEL